MQWSRATSARQWGKAASKKLKNAAINSKSNLTKLNFGMLIILQISDIVNAKRPNNLPKLNPMPHEIDNHAVTNETLNVIDRNGRTFDININFNPFYDYNSDGK